MWYSGAFYLALSSSILLIEDLVLHVTQGLRGFAMRLPQS